MGSHSVEVDALPMCDLCRSDKESGFIRSDEVQVAAYDANIPGFGWAYACEEHFHTYGCRTGLGAGQRLVVRGRVTIA